MLARFDDRAAPPDARLLTVRCSALAALQVLADIDHHYISPNALPRAAAAVQNDGTVELWLWPRTDQAGALIFFLLRVGRPVVKTAADVVGEAWVSGDMLGRTLAGLAEAFDQEEAAHATP